MMSQPGTATGELVQLGGLEPPTSWSTAKRSNQLSYSCTRRGARCNLRAPARSDSAAAILPARGYLAALVARGPLPDKKRPGRESPGHDATLRTRIARLRRP